MSHKELHGTHAFNMRNYFNIKLIKYYLLTENEVIIGKSQTEARATAFFVADIKEVSPC